MTQLSDVTYGREGVYQCEVAIGLCANAAGWFFIHAISLPGVVSQGESEQQALENIQEALRETIAVYHAHDEHIPWERESRTTRLGERNVWITVKGT